MRVVALNQDRGIDPARKKGAAVHLEAMRAAFREAGHDVTCIDAADDAVALPALKAAARAADFVYERYALGRSLGSEVCRRMGVPHVVELNAPLADEERAFRGGVRDSELDHIEREIFSCATLVVAVSLQVAGYALDRGAKDECVIVRPNGVDASSFVPRSEDDPVRERLVPEGRFVLGFHGRLRPWHGIELLGRAAIELLAEGHPIQLLLVGEGDFEAALGDGFPSQHVTRVPWVPHEEMPAFVAAFDALPLTYAPDGPSYFSPLKLAEAMACGVVPVYPPLGDLPHLLSDGRDALSYRPGDAKDLARALGRLIEDERLRLSLADAAILNARKRSWRGIADDVVMSLRYSSHRQAGASAPDEARRVGG